MGSAHPLGARKTRRPKIIAATLAAQGPRPELFKNRLTSPVLGRIGESVSPTLLLSCLRATTLLALGVSAALYADYTSFEPSFCDAGSACASVRRSGFGYVPLFGTYVPVPLFGLVGFGLLFVLTLLPNLKWRRYLTTTCAYTGAAIALILISLQAFKIGQFCLLCLIVDLCALLAAALAFALGPNGWRRLAEQVGSPDRLGATFEGPLRAWAWLTLGALCIIGPLVWSSLKPPPKVPADILALYKPGKINVVEFADFQCPFCRRLHRSLTRLLEAHGDRVHFVRLNMPLDQHKYARGAARAYVCAQAQDHGEAMAEALFEAKRLTKQAIKEQAEALGLDARRFGECLRAPQTDSLIDKQAQILRNAGFEGLPTTYIGEQRLIGAVSDEKLQESLELAELGSTAPRLPAPIFVGLLVSLAGAAIALGRAPAAEVAAQRREPRSAGN